jgi:hypothetical protein
MPRSLWNRPWHSRIWPTNTNGGYPESSITEVTQKASLGIALSGGGTRSATASFGQMRALHDLGLLRRCRYISANSGGAWAALPYIYSDRNDDDYFGADRFSTDDATPATIHRLPSPHGFLYRMTKAEVIRLRAHYSGDEAFSRIMGVILLQKIDPEETKPNETNLDQPDRSFTYNDDDLNAIAALNNIPLDSPEFHDLKDHFFTVPKTESSTSPSLFKPYLIVSAAQYSGVPRKPNLSNRNNRHRPHKPFPQIKTSDLLSHIEFTPRYSGIRCHHQPSKNFRYHDIGGGYTDSFAFDSRLLTRASPTATVAQVEIQASSSPVTVNPEHVTALSDVVGTSGAAPAQWIRRLGRLTIPFTLPFTFGQ